MMDTLLLDANWDLTLDRGGHIAVATGAYAQAQDAASEIKLFQGELYYDTTRGIPYWQQILGKLPPTSLVKAKWEAAALLVPGTVTAQVFLRSFDRRTRVVVGEVQIRNSVGQRSSTAFGVGV